RRDFFFEPERTAARFGLSEGESAQIATIDRGEVEAFSRSLFGKRALDARRAMPLTARALGETFDNLLIDAVTARSGAPQRADCAALTRRLIQMTSRGEIAPWIVDIARFEWAFIESARPGIRLRRFHHDVGAMSRAVSAGAAFAVDRRTTIGIWARPPGGVLRWRLFRL
ncbi:MAG: hypothetical protein N2444_10780, partial [Methylocystis sp.]|nr:hypothetical protein [Methylocystis sp.]